MNFKTLISTTLAVTTILSGGEALAGQERYNPNTFARELNSLNWTAGYDVEFSHLRSCSQYNSNTYVHVNGQDWIDNLSVNVMKHYRQTSTLISIKMTRWFMVTTL